MQVLYASRQKTTLDIFSAGFSDKPSAPIKKKIIPDSDGIFKIVVPTDGFPGPQLVSVTAESWNGKSAETSIRIEDSDSDIPSFTVKAMDGKVKADWGPVPLASGL